MTELANGFLVVRSSRACDYVGPLRIERRGLSEDLYYSGFERMQWEELDGLRVRGQLNGEVRSAFDQVVAAWDTFGLWLCRDLGLAKQLLLASNAIHQANELIAVRCPLWDSLSAPLALQEGAATSLGLDCMYWANGSLLAQGAFMFPEHFPNWGKRLNVHGLLGGVDLASEYATYYRSVADRGLVESAPAPPDDQPLVLEIFRVES